MSAAGLYLFTTNGGNNWTPPTTPPGFTATAISQDGAIVAGAGAAWAYTLDGGDTWLTPTVAPPFAPQLFTGTLTSALAMDAAAPIRAPSTVATTGPSPPSHPRSLPPCSWAVALPISWPPARPTSSRPTVATRSPRPPRRRRSSQALAAGSESNFVVTSGTSWAFSVDGGDTWTMASGPVPAFVANFVAGCGGQPFVAADVGGNWAYSTDGGNTWASPTARRRSCSSSTPLTTLAWPQSGPSPIA